MYQAEDTTAGCVDGCDELTYVQDQLERLIAARLHRPLDAFETASWSALIKREHELIGTPPVAERANATNPLIAV